MYIILYYSHVVSIIIHTQPLWYNTVWKWSLSSHEFIQIIYSTMDLNHPHCRYHAQMQRVLTYIWRNIDHALDNNPPALPPGDGSLMIKVLRYKLDRARRQSFYIIDTPSRKFPEPIIHLTGSYGNLYQITFTPTRISCSCDDSSNPCKHILHVLTLLRSPLINIFPVQVITLIHVNTLNQQVLDPHSSLLFLHGT